MDSRAASVFLYRNCIEINVRRLFVEMFLDVGAVSTCHLPHNRDTEQHINPVWPTIWSIGSGGFVWRSAVPRRYAYNNIVIIHGCYNRKVFAVLGRVGLVVFLCLILGVAKKFVV